MIGQDISGWCSVVGHRQMGMVLDIAVIGRLPRARPGPPEEGPEAPPGVSAGAARDLDFMADPGPAFTAYDPALPPLQRHRAPPDVHRAELDGRSRRA